MVLFVGRVAWAQSVSQSDSTAVEDLVLDDFEGYEASGIPSEWMWINDRALTPFTSRYNSDRRSFLVQQEAGNRFVRVTTDNEWHRIVLPNDDRVDWSLRDRPCVEWDWRALQLPAGAREDKVNDTGAAVYVFFGRDWLGRPKSIKYSYSTLLPVGSTRSFGPLKLLVVSSGIDGTGEWVHVRRNVAEDYRALFGKTAPEHPALIALWSDTDTSKGSAIADFDNLRAAVCR